MTLQETMLCHTYFIMGKYHTIFKTQFYSVYTHDKKLKVSFAGGCN